MQRLFNDNMYRFDRPEPSYWETTAGDVVLRAAPLSAEDSCDVVIIGGGYTGLSAAYHMARDYNIDVRVLEAGKVGWGASGRNGGFCSIGGSKLDALQLTARYGLDAAKHYYQSQVEAVEIVRELIIDEKIDTPIQGDSELEVAGSKRSFEERKVYAQYLRQAFGLQSEVVNAEQFRERYFDCTEQFGASILQPTFGLHPMRFVTGLAAAAENHGAVIHPYSEVISWSKAGGKHCIATRAGTLRAQHVIMAGNGFMPENLHPAFAGRPMPMISAIIVTRPLTDEELSRHSWSTDCPAITSRRLLNYFRVLPDRRFMFGGRGDTSGHEDGARQTYKQLAKRMRSLWPHWSDVAIDFQWHGLICMTTRGTPSIGRLEDDPSVFYGFGYHGNGVNTAVWSGKQIADWLAAEGSGVSDFENRLPPMVRGLSGRFPLPALRRFYLQTAIAMYRLQEKFS